MAPVCKFWTQGNCKFGDQCKFDHPARNGPQSNNRSRQPQVNQPQNRFDLGSRISVPGQVPNGPRHQNGRSPARDPRDARDQEAVFGITQEVIQNDLTYERPLWMMSGYGPGKNAPIQLFGGPEIEQSPEEIRCLHYQALAANNMQQSAQIEAQLAETANQQVQAVLMDLNGALTYLANGLKQHPNRIEVCESNTSHKKPNGPFSTLTKWYKDREEQQQAQTNQPGPTGFGQQRNTGFGQQQNTGFGQQQSTGFGTKPANIPASNTGFGGGFGQAGFGQQAAPAPAMTGGFGQSPQIGFGGNAVQQPQLNGFGSQPQAPIQSSMGGFGQQQPMQTSSMGFGQQQPQQPQQTSLFGQPPGSQPNGMFGQAMQSPTQQQGQLPFGQSFSHAQNSNTNNSGFGGHRPDNVMDDSIPVPVPAAPNIPMTNGILTPIASPKLAANAPATALSLEVTTYSTRNGNTLQTWKGRPVKYDTAGVPCYQRPDGGVERIWFPEGPPKPTQATSMADVKYVEPTISAYTFLKENGNFKDETVPDIAPSLDMLRWDL